MISEAHHPETPALLCTWLCWQGAATDQLCKQGLPARLLGVAKGGQTGMPHRLISGQIRKEGERGFRGSLRDASKEGQAGVGAAMQAREVHPTGFTISPLQA